MSACNADYQREFRKIQESRQGYKGQWNWAAFLGGPLWGLYQGVWQASLLYIIIGFISFGFGAIIYAFVLGVCGTYLLYSAAIKKRQLPF